MNGNAGCLCLLLPVLLAGCRSHPAAAGWQPLLRGEAMAGWRITDFGGQGEVRFGDGLVQLELGAPLTGITWTRAFPTCDYEIELLAARTRGDDFFLGLTFPVGEAHLTLVLGGWGGTVCGLSSLDGLDAASNPTCRFRSFTRGQRYRVQLAVQLERVRVWLDGQPFLDVDLRGHQLSLRPEVGLSRPLGCASYATAAELRDLRWRPMPAAR